MKTGMRNTMMKSVEMDLKPFMNLMVVLIPMLLLSAEFAKVAIVDIQLPQDRGSTPARPDKTPPLTDNKLKLTAIITDSAVTLAAKGGFLPSIRYREFHTYIARDDQTKFTVAYEPGKTVYHPVNGRAMTVFERDDILLHACDEQGTIVRALYTKYNELVTDADGKPLAGVAAGDTAYVLSNPRRRAVVDNPQDFTLQPLSVYDELQNRLMKIGERYSDAEDRNAIIIAAENEVVYDKIVQLMDRARSANYPEISISKLRG
jgi:biopolymer transport protein ExbD